jgi:hypothetical protein
MLVAVVYLNQLMVEEEEGQVKMLQIAQMYVDY